MTVQTTVSGACRVCSWGDRVVLHGVPWCPQLPAVAHIDTNAGLWTIEAHISRPVEIGELVLLVDDGDGPDVPFASWGRVESRGEGASGAIVRFTPAAHTDGVPGWLYAAPRPG